MLIYRVYTVVNYTLKLYLKIKINLKNITICNVFKKIILIMLYLKALRHINTTTLFMYVYFSYLRVFDIKCYTNN